MVDRGLSSAVDWALAAGKPLAISKSRLFRHLFQCNPSICVEENSLVEILDNGTLPLKKVWNDWTEENLIWDYEEIVSKSIANQSISKEGKRNKINYYLGKLLIKFGLKKSKNISLNNWTKVNDESSDNHVPFKEYQTVILPPTFSLNRILDNEARLLYKPAIQFLAENFPKLIAKKIKEANIQQAFVLDTAVRLSRYKSQPTKMLAVGAFEDTAAEALKMLRFDIDEIDPILNCDIHTYLTKPSMIGGQKYDIIVSTSVIEHVKEDEEFIHDIAYLLKPGGYAILTCDFKDQYIPGEDIPDVDFRFYTQKDLKHRLMGVIPECALIDIPNWDCETPDFIFLNKYIYTFASFVFVKK